MQGLIWPDLSEEQMRRLRLYESAFGYALHDLTLLVDGRRHKAHGYLPPRDQNPGRGVWSLEVWEQAHLAPAIDAAQEVLTLDPLPDPATLRQMWPMIEARAWARQRAARRTRTARDFDITPAAPASGRFFRFQGFDVSHALFDGTLSPVLRREVFVGVDAALLLPYDPQRDRVLLL
ncbi:hypothetical protein [Yoonia vestfoldensis]|uniref:hypothetical protein n=1 Tax=Yoonia vestfoldensis TaxID=245188 RepID=UPI000361B1A8|nr:hypothetical protein [Yoonia vestfoldensis]